MTLLWYTATTLSALAAIHRLFQFHAVHSLFVSCASRTDTHHQTKFENLERFFIPSRALPASKWPRLVTFEFEQDGDGVLIRVPDGSYWGTPTVRHHAQAMCREICILAGEWSVGQFMVMRPMAPIRGPPERPDSWQDICMRFGPPQLSNRPSEVRRFGSEEAQQLDHMIVSAVQDAQIYFTLCSTPLWLRIVYAASNALSPRAADTLARRILWVQIRTMFFCHDTWEYRGRCMIFRIFWPFFNEPDWVRRFELWSEEYASRQFLRLNYWLGYAFLGMQPEYSAYKLTTCKD